MPTIVFARTAIDGTGRDPLDQAAIVVEDGRIRWIGPRSALTVDTARAEIIDAGDATVIPGLIDAHCHILHIAPRTARAVDAWEPEDLIEVVAGAIASARSWLFQGVTTIRDVGAEKNLDLGLRDLIAQQRVIGPRIFGSGRPIAMTGRPSFAEEHQVNSATEARRAAREQLRAGADLIKLFASAGLGGGFGKLVWETGWEQLTVEEMQAAAVEAHKAGRTVTAHAINTQSIKNALLAGVDSVEHCVYVDEEGIAMMRERGTIMVPTLAISEALATRGTQFGHPPRMEVFGRAAVARAAYRVGLAREAGVRIAAGTDPTRPVTIVDECLCLQQAGLTPMEVIQSATRVGAELVRAADRLGTLEVGKLADLVILDGNPLDDLRALERVQWVLKEGAVMRSPEMQAAAPSVPLWR